MIEDVKIKELKVIPDERGRVMETLRSDDDIFMKFGQVYITTAYPSIVKGWHYHKIQIDNFTCIHGMMKLVLYDAREKSATHGAVNEFFLGVHAPRLVQIPAGVYHGFKCISDCEAIVLNVPTEVYNHDEPDEFRVDPHNNDIPYDWNISEK
ncbi:MAG: dTDP-4-dehydrorhamnose 3,5-epimerase [bacterium]|nr:dTDP-4-dehydrorhamnose 3,5-epimerase [bacterium]